MEKILLGRVALCDPPTAGPPWLVLRLAWCAMAGATLGATDTSYRVSFSQKCLSADVGVSSLINPSPSPQRKLIQIKESDLLEMSILFFFFHKPLFSEIQHTEK